MRNKESFGEPPFWFEPGQKEAKRKTSINLWGLHYFETPSEPGKGTIRQSGPETCWTILALTTCVPGVDSRTHNTHRESL